MILVFKTFRGKYKLDNDRVVHEAPLGMLISPIILGSLVVIGFFFPNLLSNYLLKPALTSVLPVLSEAEVLELKIEAWHGVLNPELWMTIGVVVLGTILYLNLRKWYRIYNSYPQSLTVNNLYNQALDKMEDISGSITNFYMTGFIRDYLVYIFAFVIVVVGGSIWLFDGVSFDSSNDNPVTLFEIAIMIAAVVSAVSVLFSKTRITSIVAVGALGFLVAFFFVLFRAPDLALTQLVVETVTTALFLLCFYHLPQLRKEITRIPFKLTNAIISIGAGTVVTIVALSVNGNRLFDSISSYYENAYELAGAKNIVNSILVDFRGIDTMLEILVLSIAGLGVYSLIKLRLAKEGSDEGAE